MPSRWLTTDPIMDPEFVLLGDALWLDFVNTAPAAAHSSDSLPDIDAYDRWIRACRLRPDPARPALAAVRQFRRQLRGLADAMMSHAPIPSAVAGMLNQLLDARTGHERLVREGGHWQVRFLPHHPPTAQVAIARSAAATLAETGALVRACANPACGLLLLDTTPQHDRHWCSEDRCGHAGGVERRRGALR